LTGMAVVSEMSYYIVRGNLQSEIN
jgi:hypothetical protein